MLLRFSLSIALFLLALPSPAQIPPAFEALNTPEQLARFEAQEALIDEVVIVVENVFNPENPEENKRLHRIANRLHITTRSHVVESILLFKAGDHFSRQVLEESSRLLRLQGYVADAAIRIMHHDPVRNAVTIEARVRDAWSFTPEVNFGRNGGVNEYGVAIDDTNVLGSGKEVVFAYDSNVDRTERYVGYGDPNLGGTRARLDVSLANNSDGDRYRLFLQRPFYALDARWAAGIELLDDERIEPKYDLGEVIDEFRHDRRYFELMGGWSRGLRDDRTLRWLVGATYDEHEFMPTLEVPDPILLPTDRTLAYPWVGFQLIENDYRQLTQLNTMGRTEDIAFGLDLEIRLGYSSTALGADRRAWMVEANASKGWQPGDGRYLFLRSFAQSRWEDSATRNASLGLTLRYLQRNLDQRHLFLVTFDALASHRLDPEQQVLLGGDNGLHGYPIRYQAGKHRAVISIEQRFFTDWYPWRLFQIGTALFFDVGRTWGPDPRGTVARGTLYDVGVGLRLASPRASRTLVVHVDLAFPLNRDDGIDSAQIVIGTKRSF